MEDDAMAAAAGDATSKVLGDDDLLAEILLRVGFPTTLVCAAAVCKHWLHHVSDKAFLRRFRKLNPPRLLGFYIERFVGSPSFVPMLRQPPELAAAARIVQGYGLCADNERVQILDSRNGSVFTSRYGPILGVQSPLWPERAMAIDPPLQLSPHHQQWYDQPLIVSREEKDGGLSYFCVLLENPMMRDITSATNFTAHVFMLKDGVWCLLTSATTRLHHWPPILRAVLVDNKIYIMGLLQLPQEVGDINVLDLTTSTFSRIQLPRLGDFMISQDADASSVYLIGVKEHQLGIWLQKGDSWSRVDTICLHEVCANMMSDCGVKDVCTSPLRINHVGKNAEFVLLLMGRSVLYLDTRCRTLRPFYEIPEDEPYNGIVSIQPFTMIWPPSFLR